MEKLRLFLKISYISERKTLSYILLFNYNNIHPIHLKNFQFYYLKFKQTR